MSRGAYVSFDGKNMKIFTPYIEDLVDDIRDLPSRTWNPDERCWIVPIEFRSLVEDILSNYFGANVQFEKSSQEPTGHWLEELFEAVPQQHRKKVYRALAFAFHSDQGGDDEIMRQVNSIYEQYK